jgi:hypothetical protein
MTKFLLSVLLVVLSFSSSFAQKRRKKDKDLPPYSECIQQAKSLYMHEEYLFAGKRYELAFYVKKPSSIEYLNAAKAWAKVGNSTRAIENLSKLSKSKYSNLLRIFQDRSFDFLKEEKAWSGIMTRIEKNKLKEDKGLDAVAIDVLDELHELDQAKRREVESAEAKFDPDSEEVISYWNDIMKQDKRNQEKFYALLEKDGWLGYKLVGKRGEATQFLITQHALPDFQVKVLPYLEEAVKNKNGNPLYLAMLSDRLLVNRGEEQVYGTQIGTNPLTGQKYVFPIKDEENVDKRRVEIGLEPLQMYLDKMGY